MTSRKWRRSTGTFSGWFGAREHPRAHDVHDPDPEIEDHQLALAKGAPGRSQGRGRIAWRVETPADVGDVARNNSETLGVPIDHS